MTELDLFNQALAEIGDFQIPLGSEITASGATAANPVVVTATSHGLSTGAYVFLSTFSEMAEANHRIFQVVAADANSLELREGSARTPLDGSDFTAQTSSAVLVSLTATRALDACYRLWPKVRQEILEEHSWNCATRYHRLARLGSALTITGISKANPAVVTTSGAHGLVQGDLVYVEAVAGMVQVNGKFFTVGTVPTTTTFQLSGVDSTDYDTYSSGGTAQKALQPLSPDFGFSYRYAAPADMLRMLNIAQAGYEDEKWERVGDEIYTDLGITAQIRYTKALYQPGEYPAKLASYMASRLASRVILALTESRSKAEDQRKIAEANRRIALRADGQEQSASELSETSWILARR